MQAGRAVSLRLMPYCRDVEAALAVLIGRGRQGGAGREFRGKGEAEDDVVQDGTKTGSAGQCRGET